MQRILQADNLNKFYDTIVIGTITWIGHLLKSEFMTFFLLPFVKVDNITFAQNKIKPVCSQCVLSCLGECKVYV